MARAEVLSILECDVKLILSDCDGVLLDWDAAFRKWMAAKGYPVLRYDVYGVQGRYGVSREYGRELVKEFNNDVDIISDLPVFRDAQEVVAKLNAQGYKLRVITSLSLNPAAVAARESNLYRVFGDAIESVVCLDTGADKDSALEPYKDTGMIWVEDKPENAEVGKRLGLCSFLIAHEHNADYQGVEVVETWEEIYQQIN